jgi:hypothetical protein
MTAGVAGAVLTACGGATEASEADVSSGVAPAPSPPPSGSAPSPAPVPAPAPTPPSVTPPPGPAASGSIVNADPSNYLTKLRALKPGDTLVLASGNYGIDAAGNDTADVPGLPIFNLNGTADAPITITGPSEGPRPILHGRASHNTVRLSNASHVIVRRLDIDGRRLGGFGVAAQGPVHHITVEECFFHGLDSDQQVVAISTTGSATWGWVIRRNLIDGAGTGMYLGNSDGTSPFVDGLIEHNVIRNTVGYNIQIKHQVVWGSVPSGMPTGATATIVRHNVFSKSASSSTGALARPNLLVGDAPPSGAGSGNTVVVHGNFFHHNPSEALLQAEGRLAIYANLFVTQGTALRVQPHNGSVRDVRIFDNTVLADGDGIVVSGGALGTTQIVRGNVVYAGSGSGLRASGAGASTTQNVVGARADASSTLTAPDAAVGAMDLYPQAGALRDAPLNSSGLDSFPDWNLDFNGNPRDSSVRGAYGSTGTNPGWRPALDFKP